MDVLQNLRLRLDKTGCIHECSSLAPDQSSVLPSSFLRKSVADVLPAEAARTIMGCLDKAAAQGWQEALFSLRAQHGTKWYEVSVAATDWGTRPEGDFVLRIRDITKRKQSEEQLRFSEQRYALLAD